MTRKDYELIADAFAAVVEMIQADIESGRFSEHDASIAAEGVYQVRVQVAGRLADDNPRFDYSRFTKACGI